MADSPEQDPLLERGLRPLDTPESARALGVPFAAMAEALRANAEALQRIDSNQRKIAESIERGDKAGQVVTSTRALNDTFRGLSEIQRGLLDAVVKERGRGKGLPFAFATIAVLAALLGVLLYLRWSGDESVPRELYDRALGQERDLRTRLDGMRTRLRTEGEDTGARANEMARQLAERSSKISDLQAGNRDLARRNKELSDDLERKQGRLKNFLAIKEIADRAGAIEVRNSNLEGANRNLRERLGRTEQERERLLVLIGDRKLDERGPGPAAIRKAFEDKGVIPKTPAQPAPPAGLTSSDRRRVRKQLNRLLQQARGEETYELISFLGLADGQRLTGVKIGHYRNARLLNSLECKELEISIDEGRDTAELRCTGGYIAATGRKIPFDEGGHFIYLHGIGVKAWLAHTVIPVRVGPRGRLTWITAPGSR